MPAPDPTIETLLTLGQLAELATKDPQVGDRLRLLRLVEELWPLYRRTESIVEFSVLLGLTARKLLSERDAGQRALLINIAEHFAERYRAELDALHEQSQRGGG